MYGTESISFLAPKIWLLVPLEKKCQYLDTFLDDTTHFVEIFR